MTTNNNQKANEATTNAALRVRAALAEFRAAIEDAADGDDTERDEELARATHALDAADLLFSSAVEIATDALEG